VKPSRSNSTEFTLKGKKKKEGIEFS